MTWRRYTPIFLTICMILSGCFPILEKSIAAKRVVLDSPGPKVVLTDYTETFHWEPVDGALSYELQLVTPNFDTIRNFIVDSVLKKNQFTYSLRPGWYQWQVKALNGSSETPFSKGSFRVDSSSLSSQRVLLSSPNSGIFTNSSPINLSWQPLFEATGYQIDLDTAGFSGSGAPAFSYTTSSASIEFTPLAERSYSWRVKGLSSSINSQYSAVSSFTFDKTPPHIPVLISPIFGAKPTLPDTLTWGTISDAASYKVYLFMSDSVTLYSTLYPLKLSQTNYIFSGGIQNQKIFWSVSASDAAGNESKLSSKGYFIVGP